MNDRNEISFKDRLEKYKTEVLYDGLWKDGTNNEFYWDDGTKYVGEFQNG